MVLYRVVSVILETMNNCDGVFVIIIKVSTKNAIEAKQKTRESNENPLSWTVFSLRVVLVTQLRQKLIWKSQLENFETMIKIAIFWPSLKYKKQHFPE